MNLVNWAPHLRIVIFVLLWVGVPTFISWKYDMTPKEVIRYLWLYATGKRTRAHVLLREKEDRTKPVRWFYWIPFAGRIFIHNRDMKMHTDIHRELIISLIENTVLYFIVGLVAGYWERLRLQLSVTVITIIFLFIIPIEYKLTMWKPELFLSDGDIEYVEYVCVFSHTYWFIMLGTLIGYLARVG